MPPPTEGSKGSGKMRMRADHICEIIKLMNDDRILNLHPLIGPVQQRA